MILSYLWAVLKWRYFTRSKYKGRRAYVLGRHREIFMETFETFFVDGVQDYFLKSDFYFNGVTYLRIKKQFL